MRTPAGRINSDLRKVPGRPNRYDLSRVTPLLVVVERDVRAEAWPETYGLYLGDGKTPLSVENNPICRALKGEALVQMELCIKNRVVNAAIEVTAAPPRGAGGAILGATVLLRDVT